MTREELEFKIRSSLYFIVGALSLRSKCSEKDIERVLTVEASRLMDVIDLHMNELQNAKRCIHCGEEIKTGGHGCVIKT